MSFIHGIDDENRLALTQAILIYKRPKRDGTYASLHDVEPGDKGSQIMPGVPLTEQALLKALTALKRDKVKPAQFIPPELLAQSPDTVCWWIKGSVRCLFFRADTTIKLPDGDAVPVPGLVFFQRSGKLSVFAVKGSQRPSPDTLLHVAPFPNLYSDGRLCAGSMLMGSQTKTPAEIIQKTTDGFFSSQFSHTNAVRLTRFDTGVYALWSSLIGKSRFPEGTLLKTKITLGDLIRSSHSAHD